MTPQPPTTEPTPQQTMLDRFLEDARTCQKKYKFGLCFEEDLVYYGIQLGTQRKIVDEKEKNVPINYVITNQKELCQVFGSKVNIGGEEVFFKNLTFLDTMRSMSPNMVNCSILGNLTMLTPRTMTILTPGHFQKGEKKDTPDTFEQYTNNNNIYIYNVLSDFLGSCRREEEHRSRCQDSQHRQDGQVGISGGQDSYIDCSEEEIFEYHFSDNSFLTPEAKVVLTNPQPNKRVQIHAFQVFNLIKEKMKYYVGLPEEGDYDLLALYAMATYIYLVFPAFPYIQVSAIKESGKTRMLNAMAQVCFASLFTSSQRTSPLFRFIDGNGGTIIFDEAEGIALDPDKLQIINAGYSKAGGGVLLTDKNNHHIQEMFDTYSPKLFGSINNLPETVVTRSIRIAIEKSSLDIYDDRIPTFDKDFPIIRDLLYVFGLTHGLDVQKVFKEMKTKPEGVRHRYWELYKPLVAIAEYIAPKEFVDGLLSYISDKVYLEKKSRLLEDDDSVAMCALVKFVRAENFYDLGTLTKIIRVERGAMDIIDKESEQIRHMDESYKHMNGKWVSEFLRRVNLPRRGTKQGRATRYSGSRGRYLKPRDVIDQAMRMNVVEIDPLTQEYKLITDGSIIPNPNPPTTPTQTDTLGSTTPSEVLVGEPITPLVEAPSEPTIKVSEVEQEIVYKNNQTRDARRAIAAMLYSGVLEIQKIQFDLSNQNHDYDAIKVAIKDLKEHGYITENDGFFVLMKDKEEFKLIFEN